MEVDLNPGQLFPNALEVAVLERIVADNPGLKLDTSRLHVLDRTFTGVGSFTKFLTEGSGDRRHVATSAKIALPGLIEGLGNVAFLVGNELELLEIYTYGDEKWDGGYEGFTVTPGA